jgi:hypothetical protein
MILRESSRRLGPVRRLLDGGDPGRWAGGPSLPSRSGGRHLKGQVALDVDGHVVAKVVSLIHYVVEITAIAEIPRARFQIPPGAHR